MSVTRRRLIVLAFASVVASVVAVGLSACGETDTKLKVTGLEPEKGDTEGGQIVIIKGNRFIADGARTAKIFFGSRQGTILRFKSDTELVVEAPGGKPGETVDVLIIFEPGGEKLIQHGFTFVEKSRGGASVDDLNTSHK